MNARDRASIRLAFPMRGEERPLPLDLGFSVEADLQHFEFSREGPEPPKHVGGALPTQRLYAFDQ